jgi:hypothetical protein
MPLLVTISRRRHVCNLATGPGSGKFCGIGMRGTSESPAQPSTAIGMQYLWRDVGSFGRITVTWWLAARTRKQPPKVTFVAFVSELCKYRQHQATSSIRSLTMALAHIAQSKALLRRMSLLRNVPPQEAFRFYQSHRVSIHTTVSRPSVYHTLSHVDIPPTRSLQTCPWVERSCIVVK